MWKNNLLIVNGVGNMGLGACPQKNFFEPTPSKRSGNPFSRMEMYFFTTDLHVKKEKQNSQHSFIEF